GHREWVVAVAFAPDGRTLASGSLDGTVRLWEVATGQERRRFEGHRAAFAVSYSSDGRRLASGGADSTALVWELSPRTDLPPTGTPRLTDRELEGFWADLAGADAARAYLAVCRLAAAHPQSVPFLRGRLRPVPEGQRTQIERWVTDLGHDRFAVREAARKELERFVEVAEPALRKALEGQPPLEVRRRVERLLQNLEGSARLRGLRVVEVLERVATRPARELLQALATGAPQARLTEEARKTLERLDRPAAAAP